MAVLFPLNVRAVKAIVVMILVNSAPKVSAQSCSGLPSSQSPNQAKTLLGTNRTGDCFGSKPCPDRTYRINTPSGYDLTQQSKIVIMFHGWGGSGRSYTRSAWVGVADTYNYILVAPDGLDGGPRTSSSWTFPGSRDGIGQDGIGQDGSITTCNTSQTTPDYCYTNSCDSCPSRCGWTHCEDDDFQFVVDLIADLRNYVCVDSTSVYAVGISNGGMFTWSLGQDSRTAPLLAGIAPIIGLPHHDYNLPNAAGDLPVIGIYGNTDCTVPPGDGSDVFVETCDGEGYYYVDAFHIHATWASNQGCVTDPPYVYISSRSEVICHTHCDGVTPLSVDCRADMGHLSPTWTLDVALNFFQEHAGGGEPPSEPPSECSQYNSHNPCVSNGCTWSQGSCI